MSYQSFEQILQKCHTEGKEFWQVILEDDMAERNVSKQDSMEHMRTTWDAMLLADVPPVRSSIFKISLIVVVLPEPFGPISPII